VDPPLRRVRVGPSAVELRAHWYVKFQPFWPATNFLGFLDNFDSTAHDAYILSCGLLPRPELQPSRKFLSSTPKDASERRLPNQARPLGTHMLAETSDTTLVNHFHANAITADPLDSLEAAIVESDVRPLPHAPNAKLSSKALHEPLVHFMDDINLPSPNVLDSPAMSPVRVYHYNVSDIPKSLLDTPSQRDSCAPRTLRRPLKKPSTPRINLRSQVKKDKRTNGATSRPLAIDDGSVTRVKRPGVLYIRLDSGLDRRQKRRKDSKLCSAGVKGDTMKQTVTVSSGSKPA
jgi:hypothetical protein